MTIHDFRDRREPDLTGVRFLREPEARDHQVDERERNQIGAAADREERHIAHAAAERIAGKFDDRGAREIARDRAQRDEKHYATLANQTDTLLAALLGKVKELSIDNSTHHNHVILTPDFLGELAEARRQIVVPMADGRAAQN